MPTPIFEQIHHLENAGVLYDIGKGKFPIKFKKMNLIYGFNGSGKTTISRLLSCISNTELYDNIPDSIEFSFQLSDKSIVSHDNLSCIISKKLFVFNEDYVEQSLHWKEGSAKPIIFIGKDQAELAKKLTEQEGFEQAAAQDELLKSSECSAQRRALETFCRDKARLISEETLLGRQYNANDLKRDYESIDINPSLKIDEIDRKNLKELIYKSDTPTQLPLEKCHIDGEGVAVHVSYILSLQIGNVVLGELHRRMDAMPWISEGVRLHKGEKDCLFCGCAIAEERIVMLNRALNGGFEELAKRIEQAIGQVREYIEKIRADVARFQFLPDCMPSFREDISRIRRDIAEHLNNAEKIADDWIQTLERKRANPASTFHNIPLKNWNEQLQNQISSLNKLITSNNSVIENFSNEQSEARIRLKMHFLSDSKSGFETAVALDMEATKLFEAAKDDLNAIRRTMAEIRAELRAHGPAAVELNRLLKSYLGHGQITLEPVENGYRLYRKGRESKKPLSEGEKTAIAFCHFMTALNAPGHNVNDAIVVLDDPISSLDARSMTHVVSMIRSDLAECEQLFILTHNLEFMREIKKWMGSKKYEENVEFFFIECGILNDNRCSVIVRMPKLIREYESEYHYLYSLVKIISESPAESEHFSYLMPNAIRKLLDIFLAFKIPGGMGLGAKVSKIIQDYPDLDASKVRSMEHLAQLESHSESIGDFTTFSAYTLSQISESATCLLNLIETIDGSHKAAMDQLCKK